MIQKKIELNTRPFQPLFKAANDLLKLAHPYFNQIQEHGKRFEETGDISTPPSDIWQLEKSLSIGSFMVSYAGMEAFVNCILRDFGVREVVDLSSDYFIGPLSKIKNKLQNKLFNNWHLATRVFLIIPLCSDPEIDPRSVFDTTCDEWKKFKEVIQIRHSFNHAVGGKTDLIITKAGPKLWLIDDKNPVNFWPLTDTPRDHRTLNFTATSKLNQIIDWIVDKLRSSLPTQLNDTYMGKEQGRVSDL